MKLLHKPPAQKYRQLLLVLIIGFFISPFLKVGVGGILAALMLLYTIILIVRSFKLPKILFSIYIAITVMAFGLELTVNMGRTPSSYPVFELLAQATFALYLGGAAYWIGQDIFKTPKVTGESSLLDN